MQMDAPNHIWSKTSTLYVSLKIDKSSSAGKKIASQLKACKLDTNNIHIALLKIRFPTSIKNKLTENNDLFTFITSKFRRHLGLELHSQQGKYKIEDDYLVRDYTDDNSYALPYRRFILQVVHQIHEMVYGVWPGPDHLKVFKQPYITDKKVQDFNMIVSSLSTSDEPLYGGKSTLR
jgi:hypothetical protein